MSYVEKEVAYLYERYRIVWKNYYKMMEEEKRRDQNRKDLITRSG